MLVGKRAWGLALNGDESLLFVANGLSDDVSVVDTAAAKALRSVKVGRVPHTRGGGRLRHAWRPVDRWRLDPAIRRCRLSLLLSALSLLPVPARCPGPGRRPRRRPAPLPSPQARERRHRLSQLAGRSALRRNRTERDSRRIPAARPVPGAALALAESSFALTAQGLEVSLDEVAGERPGGGGRSRSRPGPRAACRPSSSTCPAIGWRRWRRISDSSATRLPLLFNATADDDRLRGAELPSAGVPRHAQRADADRRAGAAAGRAALGAGAGAPGARRSGPAHRPGVRRSRRASSGSRRSRRGRSSCPTIRASASWATSRCSPATSTTTQSR